MSEEQGARGKSNNSSALDDIASSTKKDRMTWIRERIIPIVSLSMALFTITIAYFTISRAIRSGRQLQTISDDLKVTSEELRAEYKNISQNLTTRYLGDFPVPLKELAGVLKEVHPGEDITIICDFPGYGLFSDYESFQEYEKNIKRHVSKNVPITMIVLRWENQQTIREAQLRNREIGEIKRHPKFIQFLGWSGYSPDDIHTKEDLFAALQKEQMHVWEAFRGVQTRCMYNEKSMPMFLWIVGDREAVFSIPDLGKTDKSNAVETMFTTRDQRLIKQLKAIAQSYKDTSTCKPPPNNSFNPTPR